MQRTKIKKLNEETKEWDTLGEIKQIKNQKGIPNAILFADPHLRDDKPICRTDNFTMVQFEKMEFVKQVQELFACAIICSGDIFNHWKPSPLLLSQIIDTLNNPKEDIKYPPIYTVYGNHDLPQWNIQLSYKTGVRTLDTADIIEVLREVHWGKFPKEGSLLFPEYDRKVLVWHVMTFPEGQPPWPGCEDMTAEEILDKYPQFDLIVTGHNHSTFVVEREDRLLVNPGSLTRQTADQVDHHPCVFLWYAEDNTVEKVIVPHQEGVISREHIDKVKERDERVEHFISQLSSQYKVGLSFEENLERFKEKNRVRESVMEIIRRAVE